MIFVQHLHSHCSVSVSQLQHRGGWSPRWGTEVSELCLARKRTRSSGSPLVQARAPASSRARRQTHEGLEAHSGATAQSGPSHQLQEVAAMSSGNSACHCAVRTVRSGAGVRQQGLRFIGMSKTLKNDRHIANAHVGFGVVALVVTAGSTARRTPDQALRRRGRWPPFGRSVF